MYGYIYLTTNKLNGSIYIGKKKSSIFLGNKYLGSGKILKKAIGKYGKDNFSVVLIEDCSSLDVLNDREKYWIARYRSMNKFNLYNIADGGDGGKLTPLGGNYGKRFSEETIKKLKKSHLGKKLSLETKQKISNKNKGRKHTEEVKRKIGEANRKYHKGKKAMVETKLKISKALTGRKHTDVSKKLMSDKKRGKNLSEEHKQNISKAMKGKKHTTETKIKISNALKIKYKNM